MPKYINADELMKGLAMFYKRMNWLPIEVHFSLNDMQNNIAYMDESDTINVIRCKDCKHFSMTTLGMPYACWHGASEPWGETGEHAHHTLATRIDSPEHFCGYAERR